MQKDFSVKRIRRSTCHNSRKQLPPITPAMKIIRNYPLSYSPLSLDQWFNRAFAGLDPVARLFPSPPPTEWLGRAQLPADLFEDDHHYHVRVEIPGARKEDIGVRIEDGSLHVSYQRANGENRPGLSLTRSFRLPGPVAVDGISARLEDGILVVTLPRHEEAKPRVIPVS